MFQRLLERNNLKYSDLTPDEKADLREIREAVKAEQVDMDKVENHLRNMIDTVTDKLTGVGENEWGFFFRRRRREHLLARLKNYRLLLEVFVRSDKMRRQAEKQLESNLATAKEGGGGGII